MIDTKELRQLAQAATPGPWYVTGNLTRYVEARIDGGLIQEVAACGPTEADNGYGPQQEANASLIAAANPATITSLLDRLEEAEKERDEMLESKKWYQRRCELMQEQQSKMRDPERTMVCDILANGALLHADFAGDRYTIPGAKGEIKMINIDKLRQALGAVQPEEVAELLDRLEEAESVLKAFGTTVQEVECWLERYRCIEREAEALRTRLEAAESDALEQARLNGMGGEREAALMAKLEAAEKERDALRAKIEQMEKQEPVWFIDERGEPKRYHKSKADYCKYGGLDLLYPLPGMKGE